MAKNTKTPVMLLQELAVKKSSTPEYELIFSKQGTHDNIFHYQVTVLNVRAVGVGRSKKEAKHEAAIKALEMLSDRGIVHMDTPSELLTKVDIPMKAPINCIPKLLDICVENKIPIAEFKEISAVGPPHCREFTYECHIANIVTRATAGSKKHARQIAAKSMLDRIMNIIPELQASTNMIIENDTEIVEMARNLSKFAPIKVNYNSKVKEFDKQFKNLMNELDINEDSVMKILELPPSENVLEQVAEQFDLEMKTSIMQEIPPIFCISINSDIPVTVIEMGCDIDEAKFKAIKQAVKILKTFLT